MVDPTQANFFGVGDPAVQHAAMRRYNFDDAPVGMTPSLRYQRNVTTWFPALKVLYPFQDELDFRYGGTFCTLVNDNFNIAWTCVAVYLVFCFVGPKFMASREAFAVRNAWRYWNLGLSLFSFAGAFRTVPHLIGLLKFEGLYVSICGMAAETYGGGGPSALWTMLFIFSKVPELVDTAFIVLGKRKLIFLHWYHHATVLLFCWHSYATRSSAGLWFIAMNYTVHAVMYMYFFLAADRSLRKASWMVALAPVVTVMQISQMVVGVSVTYLVYNYKSNDKACHISQSNFTMGFLMYLSYFALFFMFALKRYCGLCATKGSKKIKGKRD